MEFSIYFEIFRGAEGTHPISIETRELISRTLRKSGSKIQKQIFRYEDFSCRETLTYRYIAAKKFAEKYPKAFTSFKVNIFRDDEPYPFKFVIDFLSEMGISYNEDGDYVEIDLRKTPCWKVSAGFYLLKYYPEASSLEDFVDYLKRGELYFSSSYSTAYLTSGAFLPL